MPDLHHHLGLPIVGKTFIARNDVAAFLKENPEHE
jgi:hypothetical protein